MASDRDSGPPQAPRRAPVHELDTAHDGATTLARLILSPIGIKRPIEVTQLHHQCTLIQPHESYLLLFGDVNIRSGQQPSPAAPPLGRQSLLPGTTCSTIKPCRALPRSSLPCEPIHARLCRLVPRVRGVLRSSQEPLAARTPSSRPHGSATCGSTSRTTTARPRHTKSDRCSKQSRS